ncbi:hypothetical protein O6H91_10G071000 [Diphasiastrum complanatum]|uniref:Uncharacterized protein n=1 Tax=Diphasiastrum complanatum TaxID=34168 RepID=A0ACC2CI85_DIPCM|nr:hypothetical protein O6H91_10G071000 [Diphasiastrum complanatum]
MGDPEGWPQPSGLLPEGSSFFAAGFPSSVDDEKWACVELRISELINRIQPTKSSEKRRRAVAEYIQRLVGKCFDCQVFTFGSVPLKTYLPDGDIDLTAFSKHQQLNDTWANDVRSILEEEERRHKAEFRVKEVQYIHAEVKIVKCLVENIVVDISFNQLGGLCTLCFLEEVDRLIGQKHLFKRSIILVKAWCYYESRILGAHHGLISTYALETLVLYIFHVFHASLRGPLEVLFRFLDFFSNFDWEKYCVSLWGPVPLSSLRLSSLPDLAEPPRRDGGELLLRKEFLDACSQVYAVFPGGQDGQGRNFSLKHLNVIDPLRTSNNLGRSVSKGNFYRIRSAFGYGARKLARILEYPREEVAAELDRFFLNTWDRHGSGRRPDAPDPLDQLQRHSVSGSPLSNGIISPKYETERKPENYMDMAAANSIHDLSSSTLSAEPDVLRSALQHVTKIFTGVSSTGESSDESLESTVASSLPKVTKNESAHGSQPLKSEFGDSNQDNENTSQTVESSLQGGTRPQRGENFTKDQTSFLSGDKRDGDSHVGNVQLSMKIPFVRSTTMDSQSAFTGDIRASALNASARVAATPTQAEGVSLNSTTTVDKKEEGNLKESNRTEYLLLLASINSQHTDNDDYVLVETENLSVPVHHEVQESVSRPNTQNPVNAFPSRFVHVPSVTQLNQFPLHLQGSVALPSTYQPNFVSPSALGVSNGHSSPSLHGGSSYMTFSLPRGPVPPPLPPYMGYAGLPSPNVTPVLEDPITLTNQFSAFLPQVDEEFLQQNHNLWEQSEQGHELPGGHLSSSTENTTGRAASLIHSLPQLVISETLPFHSSAVLPSGPFPVSGALLPVATASVNHPNLYPNNNGSISEFPSEIGTATEQNTFSFENAEDELSGCFQGRGEQAGSSRTRRVTQSEVNVAGKGSERVFELAKDRTFGRAMAISDEEVSDGMRAEDGYVVSYGEEATYFPTQSGYGHAIMTVPGYPHPFPSPGSVSDPVRYPNLLHPISSQMNISSGTSVMTETPELVPYAPFPSQLTSVSCVSPMAMPSQLSSLSGSLANGPSKPFQPSGFEAGATGGGLLRHQRTMESPGASPSAYYHIPYIAMHNSCPVYMLPPNYDGNAGLDNSIGLQTSNNLGNVNEFVGVETLDEMNSRLTYGVGERLRAAGVPVSAGSRIESFPLEGSSEIAFQDSRFDPLSTDFAGHLRNLDYGRICQNPQVLSPGVIQPPILHHLPKYLQAHHPWEGPGRPLQPTSNSSGHTVRPGHGYVPLSSAVPNSGRSAGSYHIISGPASSSGDESPRTRRTSGTYWPSQRQNVFRDRQLSGRSITGIQNQYHGDRDGGQTYAPRHRNMGRGQSRYEVRSQSYSNESNISDEKVTERVRDMQRQDAFSKGSMQVYYGAHPSVSAVPAGTLLTPTPMAMTFDMLPQIYVNSNAVVGAASAKVPPVLVVYPYGNPMEFASESLEFASIGAVQSGAPDNELVGHVAGRSDLRRSHEPAYVTNSAGSIAIAPFQNEIYLQPSSATNQQRSSQRTYQLKEEDFPPLSFRAQQGSSSSGTGSGDNPGNQGS